MNFKLKKSDLNFQVYTATVIPTTGAENDICGISPVPIRNWILSTEEPTGIPPFIGDVWLTYSVIGNTFNLLKNNSLMVALISAYQYVDDEWKVIDAYIYQGGKWEQFSFIYTWDGYYFKDGDQYEDITGGWVNWDSPGSVTIGEVLIVESPNASKGARVGTALAVDLTDVNYIYYDSPKGKNGKAYSGYLYICTEKNEGKKVAQAVISNSGVGKVDVSTLTGPHYILLRTLGGSSGAGYGDVRAIWKE